MKKTLFFLFLIFYTLPNQAQTEPSVNLEETGIWAGLYLKIRLNKTLGYYAEDHYRARNSVDNITSFVGRPSQVYNRFGLNIFVNENFEIVVGPTLVFNFTPDPGIRITKLLP